MIKELQDRVLSIGKYLGCNEEELWSEIEPLLTETALAVIAEIENRLGEEDEETEHWCEEETGRQWSLEKIDKLKQEIKNNE